MPHYYERCKSRSDSEPPEREVASGNSSVSTCLPSLDEKEQLKTFERGRDANDSGVTIPLTDRPQKGQSTESELNGLTQEGDSRSEKGEVCPF